MADRDDKRPRRAQTQTERDVSGHAARIEREARRAAHPHRDQLDDLAAAIDGEDDGIPREIDFEGEPTKPTDVDDQGPLEPLTRREWQLWNRIDRFKTELRRSRSDTVNRITKAMGTKPPNERFTRLETRVKIIWAILIFVGTTALGAAVTVAKGLYDRGSTDGAHEIRLQQVEHTTERNRERIERLERELGPETPDTRSGASRPDKFVTPTKGPPQ